MGRYLIEKGFSLRDDDYVYLVQKWDPQNLPTPRVQILNEAESLLGPDCLSRSDWWSLLILKWHIFNIEFCKEPSSLLPCQYFPMLYIVVYVIELMHYTFFYGLNLVPLHLYVVNLWLIENWLKFSPFNRSRRAK